MYRMLVRGMFLMLALCLFSVAGFAAQIPVGFLSWDLNSISPGSGTFDITNLTGPNSFVDFPVATTLDFSSLSLTVDFLNVATPVVFDSNYFTVNLDGISFDGSDLLGQYPDGPTEATLTGVFSPLNVTLVDSTTQTLLPDFSVTLGDGASVLNDGDFQVIEATAVPEPGTWILVGCGLVGLALMRRKHFGILLRH